MKRNKSRADVSLRSSGAIHHRRRTEHRAVARSDLDGDQGRGDYCLPASNNTLANWAQGCGLTPLRAGKCSKREPLTLRWLCQNKSRWPGRLAAPILLGFHEDVAEPLAYVDMLTLMRRCRSRFAFQSTMSLCLPWQASPWKHAEVPGFQWSWEAAGPGGCEGGSVCSVLEQREKHIVPPRLPPAPLILCKTPLLVLPSAWHKWPTLSGQELPYVGEESRPCFFKSARARSGFYSGRWHRRGVKHWWGWCWENREGHWEDRDEALDCILKVRLGFSPLSAWLCRVKKNNLLNGRRWIQGKIRMIMNLSMILGIKYHDFMDEYILFMYCWELTTWIMLFSVFLYFLPLFPNWL